jgi:hypothetical protein
MEADNIRQNKGDSLHYPYMLLAGTNPIALHFITGATTACEEHNYSLHLVTQSLDENSLLDFYRITLLIRMELPWN